MIEWQQPPKDDVVIRQQADPFRKLPELAKRLGVAPVGDKHPSSWLLCTADGAYYDAFDLINALLDRIEGRI